MPGVQSQLDLANWDLGQVIPLPGPPDTPRQAAPEPDRPGTALFPGLPGLRACRPCCRWSWPQKNKQWEPPSPAVPPGSVQRGRVPALGQERLCKEAITRR